MPQGLDFHADRDLAERVPCPHCHAPPGTTCRRLHDGQPVQNFPAHIGRLHRAHELTGDQP